VKEPLLTVALLTGAASAQSRTFYDASGKVVDRASTDSAASTTFYDERGCAGLRVHEWQHDNYLRRGRSHCRKVHDKALRFYTGLSGFSSFSISALASAVAFSMASCRVSVVERIRRETRLSQ
jgi:hypothetical protein